MSWLKTSLLIVVVCGCWALVVTGSFHYEGYKIYETIPHDKVQANFLNELSEQNEEIDFFTLTKIPEVAARAMVSPKFQLDFERALIKNGMSYIVINSDVSRSIAKDRNVRKRSMSTFGFSEFHRFNEINDWLATLAKTYSSRVSVMNVGKSFEGRNLQTITITNGDGRLGKDVIFIDAGIHAREWIAPATALFVISELVENFEENKSLLADFDWVILPVVNPDGYEFSHTESRFWRKTRQPGPTMCVGTDGNRNFGFHWGEVGASVSSCSESYRGAEAFSEPETRIVRTILQSFGGKAKMYLTLHSYGQYILYPWGYTTELPENVKDLDEVARAGATALANVSGALYTVGSSTNVMYAASGGSDDYALAEAKIPIALTMELQAGGSGYDPDAAQIKPFVEENWIGIKAMAQKVQDKYRTNNPEVDGDR